MRAFFPNYYNNKWVAHTFRSIMEGIDAEVIPSARYVFSSDVALSREVVQFFPSLGYRYFSALPYHFMHRLLERRLTSDIRSSDVLYFWLTSNLAMLERVRKKKDCLLVKEMINCSLAFRSHQLSTAYSALGEIAPGLPSSEEIAAEIEFAKQMDIVFCSNRFVVKSLVDYGVPAEKCHLVSYGWSDERLNSSVSRFPCNMEKGSDEPVFLFVGSFDVRKGAADLLQAWTIANVPGKLVIAGAVDPLISKKYHKILSSENVVLLGHVEDIGPVYRAADVFVFPTWEEGGPLVTIEAMSQGLPCIVTPVGTAELFDSSDDAGIIVPFGSAEAIAEAFVVYAYDTDLRRRHGEKAKVIAQLYAWSRASLQRQNAILSM